MIKVSTYYPVQEGAHFDFAYYRDTHLANMRDWLGAACLKIECEQGVSGIPGVPPQFVAANHLYFASPEAFWPAFIPHAEKIRTDVANFTDIRYLTQFSEVYLP